MFALLRNPMAGHGAPHVFLMQTLGDARRTSIHYNSTGLQ